MVFFTLKPRRVLAACCRVEVIKGAGGVADAGQRDEAGEPAVARHLAPQDQKGGDAGGQRAVVQDIKPTRGGVFAGLKRKILSGESFFQNTYTAGAGGGTIGFAPGVAGDIVAYDSVEMVMGQASRTSSAKGRAVQSNFAFDKAGMRKGPDKEKAGSGESEARDWKRKFLLGRETRFESPGQSRARL